MIFTHKGKAVPGARLANDGNSILIFLNVSEWGLGIGRSNKTSKHSGVRMTTNHWDYFDLLMN